MLRSVWEDDVVDEKVTRKLTTILAADVEGYTATRT